MIEFVKGDLLEAPADILVNAVNCVGVMGAGVALAFKQRYPAMFQDYQRACRAGQVRAGHLHHWRSPDGTQIVNLPTKRHWRDSSRYDDIDAGLTALRAYLQQIGPTTIALPALGCGHGGLDWRRVAEMIRQSLADIDAHVFVFAPRTDA